MDKPLVSVIVPVYKVEKYLDRCVQSILSQTYRNFELLLVDDGSPDRCPEICDCYAAANDNVFALHKSNGGLSDARNHGMHFAKGKYVTFIDSDDYVSMRYLEVLVEIIIEHKADISVGGLCTFLEGSKAMPSAKGVVKTFSGIKALENMLYQDMLDTSACAMLLPLELAKKYPFPVGKFHEDEYTTYKYYASVNSVVVTSESLYFYMQRVGSIMHSFGQADYDELDAADNLVKVCMEDYPDLVSAAKSKKFSDYCQVLLKNSNIKNSDYDSYKRIITYLNNEKYSIIADKNTRLKNKLAAMLLYFGVDCLLFANKVKS